MDLNSKIKIFYCLVLIPWYEAKGELKIWHCVNEKIIKTQNRPDWEGFKIGNKNGPKI